MKLNITDSGQYQPEDTEPYEETDEKLLEILHQNPEYLADEYDHLTEEERQALANKN